ncbi:large subunit ribosomal protein L7Ae [Nematocida sp. ERTm5]|nr:large subunit ribosomal protein L7Ae [Nematocida sp. ERTm5]
MNLEYKQKNPKNKRGTGLKHTADIAKREVEAQNRLISKKKVALENALKCPPALNQFRQKMPEDIKDKIKEIFLRYKPENEEEKKERISSGNDKASKKSVIFGIRQIVKSIERKKAKLVLIGNDVDPIVVVLFLPSLCKKMGVSYAIYGSKSELGAFVGRKNAACVAIEDVPGVEEVCTDVNEIFSDKYAENMKKWGKPVSK